MCRNGILADLILSNMADGQKGRSQGDGAVLVSVVALVLRTH